MRVLAILGLLFAIIFGIIAIPEISALQDEGEALSGNISLVFGNVTGLAMIVLGLISLGSIVAAIGALWHASK